LVLRRNSGIHPFLCKLHGFSVPIFANLNHCADNLAAWAHWQPAKPQRFAQPYQCSGLTVLFACAPTIDQVPYIQAALASNLLNFDGGPQRTKNPAAENCGGISFLRFQD
jgi:hypothetical protein